MSACVWQLSIPDRAHTLIILLLLVVVWGGLAAPAIRMFLAWFIARANGRRNSMGLPACPTPDIHKTQLSSQEVSTTVKAIPPLLLQNPLMMARANPTDPTESKISAAPASSNSTPSRAKLSAKTSPSKANNQTVTSNPFWRQRAVSGTLKGLQGAGLLSKPQPEPSTPQPLSTLQVLATSVGVYAWFMTSRLTREAVALLVCVRKPLNTVGLSNDYDMWEPVLREDTLFSCDSTL